MTGDTGWFKSSHSDAASDNCVEVRFTGSDLVGVRDSKCPDGGALWLPATSWSTFVDYSLSWS